jgi:predicted DNA-binding protein (UPF0251 family)
MEHISALIRRKEAADFLGVSRGTLRKMVECGVVKLIHLQKDKRGKPKGYGYFVRQELNEVLK